VWRFVFNIIVQCKCRTPKGCFTLYITFPFRGGKSTSSKSFSFVIKWKYSHWQERLRHVSDPVRRCCWCRKFEVTEQVRTGLYRLHSNNVNSFTSLSPHFGFFACHEWGLILSSEMDEKLIEFVRKCEILYDVSNKKYSDSMGRKLNILDYNNVALFHSAKAQIQMDY